MGSDSRFPIPDSRPKCKKPTPVRSPYIPKAPPFKHLNCEWGRFGTLVSH
ncbi:hypothetical protein [Moorena sp. SIO4G3]|nr:hypothetical protein [Moorena sp. SIO4G3]